MDLGISGKWALVCAASKGLGKGCAAALVREGVNVVITARGDAALQTTATELRALNPAVQVLTVVGDITACGDHDVDTFSHQCGGTAFAQALAGGANQRPFA